MKSENSAIPRPRKPHACPTCGMPPAGPKPHTRPRVSIDTWSRGVGLPVEMVEFQEIRKLILAIEQTSPSSGVNSGFLRPSSSRPHPGHQSKPNRRVAVHLARQGRIRASGIDDGRQDCMAAFTLQAKRYFLAAWPQRGGAEPPWTRIFQDRHENG